MKITSLVTFCIAAVSAFDSDRYSFTATYDSATSEIVMVTTQPDNTWFGILLGSSEMGGNNNAGTEAIYFIANGDQSTAKNAWSSSYQAPAINNDQQTVSSTITSQTSTITLTTRRPINTNLGQQFVFPLDIAIDMGWAGNSESNNVQ